MRVTFRCIPINLNIKKSKVWRQMLLMSGVRRGLTQRMSGTVAANALVMSVCGGSWGTDVSYTPHLVNLNQTLKCALLHNPPKAELFTVTHPAFLPKLFLQLNFPLGLNTALWTTRFLPITFSTLTHLSTILSWTTINSTVSPHHCLAIKTITVKKNCF